MNCPHCEEPILEDQTVCPQCGMPLQSFATIHLLRPSTFTAIFSAFDIYIDGERVGQLENQEQVRCEVAPGEHELYLAMDRIKSPTARIALAAGQTVHVICKPGILGTGIRLKVEANP